MQQYNFPEALPAGLRIAELAVIQGELVYTSPQQMDAAFQTTPAGGVVYQTPVPDETQTVETQPARVRFVSLIGARFWKMVRLFFSLLLCAALVLWLAPLLLKEAAQQAALKPLNATGIGLASVIIVYGGAFLLFGLVLFLAIVFGILSLDGLSRTILGFGFASLGWVIAAFSLLLTYASKLVVAYWIGGLLLEKFKTSIRRKEIWGLLDRHRCVCIINRHPGDWLVDKHGGDHSGVGRNLVYLPGAPQNQPACASRSFLIKFLD